MRVAIDVSPLSSGHKVRGTGFYLKYLKNSLSTFFPEHHYSFFEEKGSFPSTVELIHYPYFDPFRLFLPLQNKKPTVITVHDLTPLKFPDHFPPGFKGAMYWQVNKALLRKADKIITDSESSKNDLIKLVSLPDEKISVVYLAAGEDFREMKISKKMKDELIQKFKLPEKFLLYVGEATWNKNLPRLLSAVKKTGFPLVLAGKALSTPVDDPENVWNKDLVSVQKEIHQNTNIYTTGFISTEDLVLLYNLATITVLPSLYEGFGLPVLEAMKCGSPVITTREGSIPEVAGDAAVFVDGYSVESIADGITTLWSSPDVLESVAVKGKKQADKFSWKETARKTIQAYESVL